MKLWEGIVVGGLTAGLVACSLSAVDRSQQLVVRFEARSSSHEKSNGVEKRAVLPQAVFTGAPPSTVTGFDCLAVNVTGPGIFDSSPNPQGNLGVLFDRLMRRESYCTYRGVVAGPLSSSMSAPQEIGLLVPPGAPRLVQVVGFKEQGGSNDCVREFNPGVPPVIGADGKPLEADAYELGRGVVDLFQDRVVTIALDWDGLTSAQQAFRLLDCGSASAFSPGSFSYVSPLATPRATPGVFFDGRTAPGKVYIAGGVGATGSTEVFDLATSTWSSPSGLSATSVGAELFAHPSNSAHLLSLGGGSGFPDIAQYQMFDGTSWGAPITIPSPAATPLTVSHSARVYDPGTNASYLFGSLPNSSDQIIKFNHATISIQRITPVLSGYRGMIAAAPLTTGAILLAGGSGSGSAGTTDCQLFYPGTPSISNCPNPLPTPFFGGVAFPLPGGDAIVTAGKVNTTTPSSMVMRYASSTGTWSIQPPLLGGPRSEAGIVKLNDGRFFIIGGKDAGGAALNTTLFWYNGGWVFGPSLNTARYAFGVVKLPSGEVLVIGGKNTGGANLGTIERWSP